MTSKIDLDLNDFSIKDILEKFSPENLKAMRSEISRFRAYDLERLETTEICLCQNTNPPCNKNAIYSDKKNANRLLCWYHALLLTKG